MVEVKDAVSWFQTVSEVGWKISKQGRAWLDGNGVPDSHLSANGSDSISVIARGQVGEELHTKAGAPDGKDVALFVLLYRVLEDIVGILSPLGRDIDIGVSSGEEDSIDPWEQIIEVAAIAVGENGDYLGAWHLHVFDVGGSNVGCVFTVGRRGRLNAFDCWLVAVSGLREDADDGSLIGEGWCECDQQQDSYGFHDRFLIMEIDGFNCAYQSFLRWD